MKFTHIPFHKTGFFSKTMTDYLDQKESIKQFYNNFPDMKIKILLQLQQATN